MFGMPRFLLDMPRPKRGRYTAIAYKRYAGCMFGERRLPMEGQWRTYIVARLMALQLDWATHSPEIELGWAITPLTETAPEVPA